MSQRDLRWLIGPALAVLMVALAASALAGPGVWSMGASTPAATPKASSEASPAASPMAQDLGPSTQIIVGEITIEIRDDAIVPRHFESAVGRDITITVVNTGSDPHNFTIEAFDIDLDLDPGDTETVEIEGPPIGNYPYFSDLPGDDGLEGTMTVFI